MHSPSISLKFRSQVHLYVPFVLVQYWEQVPNCRHSFTSEERKKDERIHPSASPTHSPVTFLTMLQGCHSVWDLSWSLAICIQRLLISGVLVILSELTLKRPLTYLQQFNASAGTEYKETFALWGLYKRRVTTGDELGATIWTLKHCVITKYQTKCHLF